MAAPLEAARELPPALPEGTILLHIGPPKTGTTSLQAAFWAAREAALRQGVRYAGSSRHSAAAILAVTGRQSFAEDRATPPIHHWERLVKEVHDAREARVVLSSEGLSYASAEAIERVVGDLGASRVHVVVTLRPLPRLLASEWQEHAQSGLRSPFDAWLEDLFSRPDRAPGRGFWHRQRHDLLIARWAAAVGIDGITAVVVDERDHGYLYRVFEALTGLREGTLVPDGSLANRSLTLEEIVAIRALAERFEAEGLSMRAFHRVVRMKVAAYMKGRAPGPGEARIETPQWALDRAGEVAAEVVAGIRASGVRVLGSLDPLVAIPRSRLEGGALPEVTISPEVAATMAMGAILAGEHPTLRGTRTGAAADARPVGELTTRQLGGALVRRVRHATARRLRRRPS